MGTARDRAERFTWALLQATWDNQIDPFALLEAVRDSSGVIVDLRYVEANDAALAYHGIPREELIGATMLHFYPGLLANGILARYFATADTGEPVVLDDYAYDNEVKGEQRFYDLRAVQVGDGVALTWRDVTERHATLQELEASQQQFRMLAENSADLVVLFSPGGQIAWTSPSLTQVLGWTTEQVLGHTGLEFTHPDDIAQSRHDLDASTHRGELSGRVRIQRADGSYRWFARTLKPVRDADGSVIGQVAGYRDIQVEVDSELALAASTAAYRLLAENASDVVFRATPTAVFEWVSPSVVDLLGWSPDELIGRAAVDYIHPDDRESLADATRRVNRGERAAYEARFACGDGSFRWLAVTARPLLDGDGAVVARVGSWRDAQQEVLARQAVKASEEMFHSAMDSAAIGMALATPDGAFLVVNPALRRILGHDADWFQHHILPEVVHPDDRPAVLAEREELIRSGRDTSIAEMRLIRSDGDIVWARRAAVVIRDAEGHPSMLMLQVEDITSEHEAREQLAHLALHDSLTGLHNRAWLLDMLDADLREARSAGEKVGVLFIDLDNFKIVNDSLGHTSGDALLIQVAARIADTANASDRLARFGGDEFIIVLPDVREVPELERVAHRVATSIAQDTWVDGHRLIPTASIGIAVSAAGSTPESLIRDADAAMFRAKNSGRSRWHFFDEDMHTEAVERLNVEAELRSAVASREFIVYYQPIVSLDDARVVGHEALVRWQHPVRGLLPPSAFLPVAEASGLIIDIGAQVLEQVTQLLATCPDLPGPISVNVSAVELAEGHWFARFNDDLNRHCVDPRQFNIEVTETSVLPTLDALLPEFTSLRERGVGLHLDDFGTGYSSISVLNELPATGLKLDASFVARLTDQLSPRHELVAALGGLAATLHLSAIAEGVETRAQAAFLREHDWTMAQGYLFGRPAPAPRMN